MDKSLGALMRTEFHRVILDEAHAIKNHHSRSELLQHLTLRAPNRSSLTIRSLSSMHQSEREVSVGPFRHAHTEQH